MAHDTTTAQLAHHLMAAVAAAERLNAQAPHDRTLLRLCIHLYDAAEQLEASPLTAESRRVARRDSLAAAD